MTKRPYKRSWKNLLLDKGYQLKFTLFMVLVSALLMAGLGYWVLLKAHSATTIAIQQLDDPRNSAFVENVDAEKERLRQKEAQIGWFLVGTGILLTLGLFVYGIKMTHRVAGPLYKVSLYLDKVANEKFDPVYPLRKGDQLVEFYDHFKDAHEELKHRQEEDVQVLRGVVEAARKAGAADKPGLAEKLAELEAVLKRKEASLG